MERLACEAHDALTHCIEEEVARRTHQRREVREHPSGLGARTLVRTHSQVLGMSVAWEQGWFRGERRWFVVLSLLCDILF